MQHRDPVCGMMIDDNEVAAESVHGSQHYYFCSITCRNRFENNPSQFLGATRDGEELEQHEPPFTVTDSIAAPKFGSAGSGGAEYERLPEQHDEDNPPKS